MINGQEGYTPNTLIPALAFQRAVVLADAAADAQLAHHGGALDDDRLAIRAGNGDFFQADGFLRGGAHLLAHNAGRGAGPGQAAVAVDRGLADHGFPLALQIQLGDRPRGAHLPAGGAAVIAVAQPAAPAPASTALPARIRRPPAAGPRWGRSSCTASSAGRWKGRRLHPAAPAGGSGQRAALAGAQVGAQQEHAQHPGPQDAQRLAAGEGREAGS